MLSGVYAELQARLHRWNVYLEDDYTIDIQVIEDRPVLIGTGDGFFIFVPCRMTFEEYDWWEPRVAKRRWREHLDEMFLRVFNGLMAHEQHEPESVDSPHGWMRLVFHAVEKIKDALDDAKARL